MNEPKEEVKKKKSNKKKKAPEPVIEQEKDPEDSGEEVWSDVKACKREIIGIYTRGTFNPALVGTSSTEKKKNQSNLLDEGFDNRFVLVYVRNALNTSIGFTFFDLTVLKFYVGSINSKKHNLLHKFRTLLM